MLGAQTGFDGLIHRSRENKIHAGRTGLHILKPLENGQRVNSFHEDYPFRLDHTLEVLQGFDDNLVGSLAI